MNSTEIRQKFLKFFEDRGHVKIPSVSLVPTDDPSVLFTTAGMQPLAPYLLGQVHPQGKRLVNIQKCLRTTDIDEVGDKTHDTFFEMLGNWSLGDYFKEEAIKWSFELLTDNEDGMGIDPSLLYVTVFGGNADAPRDDESFEIWKKYLPENRIYFLTWNGKKEPNWWDAGDNGPAGPDTEIFYDLTGKLGDMTKEEYLAADERQDVVEIWNNVFMEYLKKDGKVVGKLERKNVDTGGGLERWAMMMQGKDNIFDTDLFEPIMNCIRSIASVSNELAERIVADHIRTAVFMIADGVLPTNSDRGYILRRLLRRAVRYADIIGIRPGELFSVADSVISKYHNIYSELGEHSEKIDKEIREEEIKFRKTLKEGLKKFERGEDPFILFTTYGFPFELTKELAREKGIELDEQDFQEKFKQHQEVSRAGAEQKFKGGLAGTSEMEIKYHTATHLLHQALHDVLGDEVGQRGSNITPERLRFDFSFQRKMTDEEKKRVEDIVNEKIKEALPVQSLALDKEKAIKSGARHFFDQKYPDQVSVYYIGPSLEDAYSKEFCGGPHVTNTTELGNFRIIKEEAVSAGVRRIKASLS
ncbi:MAG: alanine--tRNA ligase [bacterium]|nr:alanine--tRNA ligase [bacterium]